ncbi:MAG: GTP pyrophosphokinase family protein [Spirochaetia bacterium]|nr:GTP pyrophosphokinase family protein [Spirochaetia bacterium]
MAFFGSLFDSGNDPLRRLLLAVMPKTKIAQWMGKNAQPYKELMAYYKCAMMAIETKFRVINEELSLKYDRNPIESIRSRLKSPESLWEKMNRRRLPFTTESIEKNIFDIAGVRVICSHTSDIYALSESLLKQDDVTLFEKKDYIANPKSNGYRSLHLIIETPIFLYETKKMMKVEVQFRTISMDWWASLEHKIRYKKNIPEELSHTVHRQLLECAETGAQLDAKMEQIQKMVAPYTDTE